MDDTTTVSALKQLVADFVHERNWEQYHTPKNLAMAISVEAAELMELFRWQTPEECDAMMSRPDTRLAATEEIADVLALCLSFANRHNIDVATALAAKMKKNAKKYPVDMVQGSGLRQYTDKQIDEFMDEDAKVDAEILRRVDELMRRREL